ncbi:MAG: PEP-CTERM sorting domain-containing protein [Verrucomicrobia bacterium]|nr:PEP-CTERM sorting domain-containing protein [Verrucomicrobiota bacterium]
MAYGKTCFAGLAWLLASLPARAINDTQNGAAGTLTTPGGAASALASSGDPSNSATAIGGSAILTTPLGGGNATATARTSNATPGASTSTVAQANGGNGGRGDATNRPAAGSATAAAVVTNGAANQSIVLAATAIGGGNGGALSNYSIAGDSGSASASVTGTAAGAALLQGTASALGGSRNAFPNPPSGGGNGGNAFATGRLDNPGGASTVLTLNAIGGDGGAWDGIPGDPLVSGRSAGQAGGVFFGQAFASAAGSVLVDVTGRGGNGGLGYRGFATSGASVSLNNVANGTAGDRVELRQTAVGGSGGGASGAFGADGGSASSLLDRTIATRTLIGRTSATGGAGGVSTLVGANGNGGTATASTRLVNPTGAAQALAQATTPVVYSTGGWTGDATAQAVANSGQAFGGIGATAQATATGGFGGGFGRGGGAQATALAQAAGGATTATAVADGGPGGVNASNLVSATAQANNTGAGGAAATASASGSHTGGSVASSATAAAAGFVVRSVRAQTGSGSSYSSTTTQDSRARLGVAPATTPSSLVWGSALGAPSAADLSGAFASAPHAAGRFDLTNPRQRLLLATFSAAPLSQVGSATVQLGATIDLASLPTSERGSLQLALLGGSGSFSTLHFRVLRASSTALDLTFTTPAEANAYFADHVLDLGALDPTATGTVAVDIILDVTGGNYAGTMFLGNAPIPEPATWLLVGVGLTVWLGQLRRRRPS